MKSAKSKLLIVVVIFVALSVRHRAGAQVPTLPPDGGFLLDTPSCDTYDAERVPSASFAPGDQLMVKGAKFPSGTFVLLSFQQPPRTGDLGRVQTNDAGEFTTQPLVRLPSSGTPGTAVIRASAADATATCEIRLTAAPAAGRPEASSEPAAGDFNPWFAAWGTLLALFGCFLAFVRLRRWQEGRLVSKMAGFNGEGAVDGLLPPPGAKAEPSEATPRSVWEEEFREPPVLPVGWDAGREPKPTRLSRAEPEPAPVQQVDPKPQPDDHVGW